MIATLLLGAWLSSITPDCLRKPDGSYEPEAWGAAWYVGDESIVIGRRRYVKHGLPRILAVSELRPVGYFQNVPVLVEKNPAETTALFYLLAHRDECSFQPYAPDETQPAASARAKHGRKRRKG